MRKYHIKIQVNQSIGDRCKRYIFRLNTKIGNVRINVTLRRVCDTTVAVETISITYSESVCVCLCVALNMKCVSNNE